jgi:CubicO group peptidase (beta-lactamase class C family)
MIAREKSRTERRRDSTLLFASVILILSMLAGCGPSSADLEAVDYAPLLGDDWEVSTPEEQGMDPMLVAELYHNASELETLYGLLVVKNGYLIAEDYFNEGSVGQKALLQSASKSYISALVGIALDQGCLSGVDQKMVNFFPEYADQITDPRKKQITIREMLQMRAGYPDEETDQAYLDALYWGEYPELIVEFPLVNDPGTSFNYSNLTFNWLAIILARACGTNLRSYAQEHLFRPTDTELGDWLRDRDGHYIGSGGIHVTARDAAQFGWLYLNHGEYRGEQIIPSDWVHDSLQTYSEKARDYGMSLSFRDLGYGYGWWTAKAGEHHFSFAWGHGGQLIVLLDKLDMVIVTTADPFFGQHDGGSWKHEKATINLVGEFIKSLPGE